MRNAGFFAALLVFLVACQPQPDPVDSAGAVDDRGLTAFVGAHVWDGTGAATLRDATLLVRDGRVVSVGSDPAPDDARVVDLAGAYVIPGLINTHGHVTANWAEADVADPMQRVRAGLELYARYGITTVLSLGGAPDAAFALRDETDPANPGHARIYLAGAVVADDTAESARNRAQANVERGVDWLKLRVDDNLGLGEKMPWESVEAVLAVGREAGIRVATHIFYREDAMRLLDMGTGMVAHSVRDVPVNDAFVTALAESGACYVPTLTREVSTFAYADSPDFLDDPFFLQYANEEQLERVTDPSFIEDMAASDVAAGYRAALVRARTNVGLLANAGARIAMGTDSGPPGRFPGYFEHLELAMMVDSGMTPEQALLSATGRAADCIDLDDVGTLQPGRWADFLVLDSDPTVEISATKSLRRVFIAGREI